MSEVNSVSAGQPPAIGEPSLSVSARVSATGFLHFSSNDLSEVSRVLAFFNLAPQAGEKQAESAAEAPGKPTRRKSDKAADTPAAPAPAPAAPAASAPAAASPSEGNVPASTAPAAAGSSTQPAAASASVTPEQAAQAVREHGAKHGIEAARALLAKHGVAKTAEITPEKAPAIYADAKASEEL